MPPEVNSDLNHQVLVILLKRIIELLDREEKEPPETLHADEVRAALRNELAAVVKSVREIPDNSDVVSQLKKLEAAVKKIELAPQITVSPSNIPDVIVPEIKIPEISAPQVTVNVPDVIVPPFNIPTPIVNVAAPIVSVPEVDLTAIIRSLEVNLNKLRTNSETRPLAVRLSDGQTWTKELKELNRQTAQTQQFMSDVSYIKNATGQRINPATDESVSAPTTIGDGSKVVTTAGTRVQLVASTTTCRYVVVTAKAANTNPIWVGGATVANGSGRPLVSLQAEKIDINDVSKIWIDAETNGEGATFFYVA
jgi:hypothetical protein